MITKCFEIIPNLRKVNLFHSQGLYFCLSWSSVNWGACHRTFGNFVARLTWFTCGFKLCMFHCHREKTDSIDKTGAFYLICKYKLIKTEKQGKFSDVFFLPFPAGCPFLLCVLPHFLRVLDAELSPSSGTLSPYSIHTHTN